MTTARIEVLTIALSTGGIAACLANGPADYKPARTNPVVQLPAASGIDSARFAIEASTAAQR